MKVIFSSIINLLVLIILCINVKCQVFDGEYAYASEREKDTESFKENTNGINIYWREDHQGYHIKRRYYDIETCCKTNITIDKAVCHTRTHFVCEDQYGESVNDRCMTKSDCEAKVRKLDDNQFKSDDEFEKMGWDWCNVRKENRRIVPNSEKLVCCIMKYLKDAKLLKRKWWPWGWPNSCGRAGSAKICLENGGFVSHGMG